MDKDTRDRVQALKKRLYDLYHQMNQLSRDKIGRPYDDSYMKICQLQRDVEAEMDYVVLALEFLESYPE